MKIQLKKVHFLPKFKREFAQYFETLLHNKVDGVRYRTKDTFTSKIVPGFSGIRLKGTSCSYFFYTNLQNKKKLKIFRKSLLKIHLNGRWTLGF